MGSQVGVVRLAGVTKRYQNGDETIEALADVDFRAERGEMVTVIGPSGSGKSTMLNVIGLLDTPTTGTVRIQTRDVTAFNENVAVVAVTHDEQLVEYGDRVVELVDGRVTA